jgi:predicted unusual protein kinase regulating ubiquinone biosynthesis (AarF/ABC1/UbiB family)
MNDVNGIDDLLSEYIQQEQQLKIDNNGIYTTAGTDGAASDAASAAYADADADDYFAKTEEYYTKMSFFDLCSALYFTLHSSYICCAEYVKYRTGWKSKTHAIIDVSKRLAGINMMYVKIFQAFATNRNILSPELNQFFNDYTDNVEYTDDEYTDEDLIELEHKATDCYPYKPIKILNNRKPIKSGLMSLIFKGRFVDDDDAADADGTGQYIAIKYLRNNIITNFNTSMNNLVVFAKLTKYIPYIRTLNIETMILQNIVSLKDQVCFRKEVTNIQRYYKSWKDCGYVKIPQPYFEFTEKINPNIIVMEFIEGRKITEIDPEDNDTFGKILALFSAKAAFCNSIYHGDLHPGNILFIKEAAAPAAAAASAPSAVYKIGLLDFGIIGHLTRMDQELLFKSAKLLYQKKYKRVIHMILKEMSEDLNSYNKPGTPVNLDDKVFDNLHKELHAVIIDYATPEIKFLGVNELYTINYILNNYNLTFRRSLYRLFITIAIMDSIATKLGSEMSYMQHMTDVVIDLFGIDAGNFVDD